MNTKINTKEIKEEKLLLYTVAVHLLVEQKMVMS